MASIWDTIERELNTVFGSVDLRIDGHRVTYQNVIVNRRLVIMTYVNGAFCGKWFQADDQGNPVHPEARFLCPRSKKTLTAKELKSWRKINPARAAQLAKEAIYWFDPCWDTPVSLVRHLKKQAGAIEIVPRRSTPDLAAMEVIEYGS